MNEILGLRVIQTNVNSRNAEITEEVPKREVFPHLIQKAIPALLRDSLVGPTPERSYVWMDKIDDRLDTADCVTAIGLWDCSHGVSGYG